MKKILFSLSLMLLSFTGTVQAQKDVKVRFGGEVGFNMNKWGGDYDDYYKTSFKPGFHIGGVAELMLNERWSIQPELVFSLEGTETDAIGKINAMYLKAPIVVYYNFKVGPGQLSPGVGPYVGGGIAGKTDGENTFGDNGVHRFDWGLQVKLAYELQKLNATKVNGLFAALGFSYGFCDTYNMALSLTVGYKFPYSKWLSSTYNKENREY